MPRRSLLITRAPVTLRNQVVDKLRTAICEQHFAPETRLVERQLCEMLGVSRTLVREALRQLEAEGFVVSLPHRGPSVAALDRQTVRGIYEVRAVLEALAGELFVARASEEDRQRLAVAIDSYRRALDREDGAAGLHATARFYEALFAGAKNEIIAATLRPLSGRIHMLRARSMSVPGRRQEARQEMEAIFRAVMDNDTSDAWQKCRQHVEKAAVYALMSFDREANKALPPVSDAGIGKSHSRRPASQVPRGKRAPGRARGDPPKR